MELERARGRRRPVAVMVASILLVGGLATLARPGEPAPGARKIVGQELTILVDDRTVRVEQAGRLVVSYRYADVSHKPYVLALTAPSGINILRDAPADHLHHHGLMFAWRADGVNFWEETAQSGRQEHTRWRAVRIASVRAAEGQGIDSSEMAILREALVWKGQGGEVFLEEDRTLSVAAAQPGQPHLLTWQATLSVPRSALAVSVSGTAYHGLGARFLRSMDVGGQFRGPGAASGVAGTNGQRSAWCAYTAEAEPDRLVTVAVFDSPDNLRHPATWFTRDKPYAFLSATLGINKEPLKLEAGRPLTLRYGVAVFDGQASKEAIEAAYARWQQIPTEGA